MALAISSVAGVTVQARAASLTIASPTFRNGDEIPLADVYDHDGCKGANQSPPLVWLHPPAGTNSYAVTMADLDAKVGVVWLWVLFGIPVSTTALQQNADATPALRPPGAHQTRNGLGSMGYQGPCPRRGSSAHHYLITVWAVDQAQLPFKDQAPAQAVAIFLRKHALAHASLTPHYGHH
ncbi:YbhB/YbcL family Raf kinase inhibitor-like protein [Acidisoma cladoniae]|uniref:YbhB/YbcL family Raf kinase inhibitor-like protein n=1 Tax=Acidisoma cladoniae TaxID=3040935 RepID=UPI00254CDBAD|nr:YbhB/YbcL family Raf kinase inhibitor-like protein [Acidisoma sp. PAMC 29798]